MLFLLLLLPVFSFAQTDESIDAFLKSRPDSLGIPVSMPDRTYYSFKEEKDSKGRHKRSFIAVITTDSEYHKIFSQYIYTKDSLKNWKLSTDSFYYKLMCKYLVDSLPVIDFSTQELVLYAACGQCMVVCNHHGKEHESCHRNACYMQESWFLRNKEFY